MPGMSAGPETRTSTHLHGARVPSESDGYPEDWFPPGKTKLSFYPNRQDATALWFHDHAMGISRFNVFAARPLGLKKRPERPQERLQARVTGLILHKALEDVAIDFPDIQIVVVAEDDDKVREGADFAGLGVDINA